MKRPKLYYMPGLISLLALPVIFLIIHPKDKMPPNCIRMYLPTDEKPTDGLDIFSKYHVLAQAAGKHINQVELWYGTGTGLEEYTHQSTLAYIHQEIGRLNLVHDTMSVLKIEMGDDLRYEDLIAVLNSLLLFKTKRYALVGDSLYIFANPAPSPPRYLEEITPVSDYVLTPEAQQVKKESAMKRFLSDSEENLRIAWHLIKHNFLLVTGFVLLILIPFLYRLLTVGGSRKNT